jgi:hypothetical protein
MISSRKLMLSMTFLKSKANEALNAEKKNCRNALFKAHEKFK